jgi:NIMA (never in mitosis gene a)-related kinase
MSCEEEKSLISNKYEIVRSIGRGSFGTVYLVRDVNTNAEYALKEILCQNENEINNAMREGFNASYLKHENLVEIKSIFVRNYHNSVTKQEELYVCILMPLYTHGDLAIHLQRRSVEEQNFTEDELLDWMIQITQGVNHLHSKEFMHRDLKPGNIFLSNDVKSLAIGDFGLAREMESTFASTVAGTLRYIAPEVLTEKRYGFGADIWSLGCIFLEMVMLVMDKNLYMDVLVNQHFYKDIIDEVTSRGYSHELGKILCDMLVRETPRMSSLDVLNRLTALRDRLQSGASEIEEASVDAPCEGECGNLATAECTTCRAYMCDECFSSTHRFGVLKQHIKMNLRKL